MSVIWKNCIYTLTLVAAGLSDLSAQDSGLDAKFKLRTGIGLSQSKDHLTRKTLGFGLDLGYTTSIGRFGVEVGYAYKPGDQYLEDLTKMPVASGSPSPSNSSGVDSRKTAMDGLSLRLSIAAGLTENWGWQAGLQVGGTRFRQEYIAHVADANWDYYEDTYNGVVVIKSNSVSPYLGATVKVGKQSELEINLLGLRYTGANYVHTAGTVLYPAFGKGHTTLDKVETTKRMMPHLELGYAIRF